MPQTDLEQLVFQMDANITSLDKAMQKAIAVVDGGAGNVEKRLKKTESAIARFGEAPEWGKALDKVFDSSRLAVLDDGASKLRIFGSALEPLGALGVAAGADVAAFAAAVEMARGAAEYAEEISNTAEKLGVTTKALQEYNFVAIASGVSTEGLKQAISEGNAALGAFQSNVGGPQMKKAFEALKISPDEARGWNNILDALPAISQRLSGLGSIAEKTQIAKRLGVEEILPILMKGGEAIADLRKEAEETGAVMDTDLVAKGKAAAEAINEASKAVDINLKRAFVELAPFIADCLKLISQMAGTVADMVENLGSVANFSRVHIDRAMPMAQQSMDIDKRLGAKVDPKTGRATPNALGMFDIPASDYNRNADFVDELNARSKYLDGVDAKAAVAAKGSGAKQLVPDPAKANHTQSAEAEAQKALDEAQKKRLEALAAITQDLQERGAQELAANAAQLKAENDALDAQIKKLDADKTITAAKKGQITATLEAAKAQNDQTAAIKAQSISAKTDEAIQAASLAQQKIVGGYYDQVAVAMKSMARTIEQRRDLEFQELAQRKRDTDTAIRTTRNRELTGNAASVAQGGVDHSADINSKYDAQQGAANDAYKANVGVTNHNNMSPLEAWANTAVQSSQEVGEALQKEAVKGIDDFNRSLADSIANSKNFGEAFRSIIKQIEADLIQLILKQAEVGIFGGGGSTTTGSSGGPNLLTLIGGMLPHFAGGTDSAPGGMALVGEKGPELVQLPGGSGVTPNSVLKSLAGSTGSRMASQTIIQGPQFHLQSPVVTDDLIQQFSGISRQHAAQAAILGAQGGKQMALDSLNQRSRYALR